MKRTTSNPPKLTAAVAGSIKPEMNSYTASTSEAMAAAVFNALADK